MVLENKIQETEINYLKYFKTGDEFKENIKISDKKLNKTNLRNMWILWLCENW